MYLHPSVRRGVGIRSTTPRRFTGVAPAGLQPQRCPPLGPHVNLEFREFSVSAAVVHMPLCRVRACCTEPDKASGKDGINIIGPNVKNPSKLPLDYSLSIDFTVQPTFAVDRCAVSFPDEVKALESPTSPVGRIDQRVPNLVSTAWGVRRIQAQSNIGALVRAAATLDHPSGSRARCARPSERRQFLIRRTMSTGTSRS